MTDPARLTDDDAMGLALAEARRALDHGDVPVGAVALVDGEVVATGRNERELRADPTAHAEILALRAAAAALGGWRLGAVTLVVTLEPCPMCAGALVAARVGRLVFGAADPKAGAVRVALQPVRRPPAEPRAARHRRRAGRRGRPSCWRPSSPTAGRATSLAPGGMRERPNRTVSKTVVGPAHRGFESHSLRSV